MSRQTSNWELFVANLLFLPILAAAWIVLGPGQALAALGALLLVDWRIVKRWKSNGGSRRHCEKGAENEKGDDAASDDDGHCDGQCQRRTGRNRYGHSDASQYADALVHLSATHHEATTDADTYAHTNIHTNTDRNADKDGYTHFHGDQYTHPYGYCYSHSDANQNTYSNEYTDTERCCGHYQPGFLSHALWHDLPVCGRRHFE